jgi:hypothetical protein
MSGWTFAWSDPDEVERREQAAWKPLGARAVALIGVAVSAWLFLFASGIFPTLGWAEGSERHDRRAIYLSEESGFGLSTIYVLAGQRLWWDYDVAVEGGGGVRLRIVKSIPARAFHVEVRDIEQTGQGRFEVVAPESGLYSFDHELVPQGVLIAGGVPGRTSYDLSWGVD